jgi:hypothetical protein
MRQINTSQTEQAGHVDGYMPAKCPECGADMDLYESVSYVDDSSSWWGVCPECRAEVEGERKSAAGS